MRRSLKWGLMTVALVSASALAQPHIENIELGFNGRFLPGTFTPIAVTLSSTETAWDLTLEVSQEIQKFPEHYVVERLQVPVSLSPRARKTISLDFPIDSVSTPLQIKLLDGTRELARSTLEVRELWSETPLILGIAIDQMPSLELIELGRLPRRWTSYDGVGRIIWGRADPARLNTEQRRALQGWLVRGGELVILSGENWYEQSSPWWTQLLPITDERVVRHPFQGQEVLWLEGTPRAGTRVSLTYQERPLVWERPVGNGKVVLVAIADLPEDMELATPPARRQTTEDDIVIAKALETLTVPFPSREVIGALLMLFVIGVWLSEALARRWRRMPLAVGVMALVVSGVLYGYQHSPGFSKELYSVDIGVIRISGGLAWERSWYGVFFPHSRDEYFTVSADAISTLARRGGIIEASSEAWKISVHGERNSTSFFKAERLMEPFVHVSLHGTEVQVSNWASLVLQDAMAYSGEVFYKLGAIPPQAELVRPLTTRIDKTEWVNTLTAERRRIWQQWGSLSSEAGLIGWLEHPSASPFGPITKEHRTALRLVLVEEDQ